MYKFARTLDRYRHDFEVLPSLSDEDEEIKALCEGSLYEFSKRAWKVSEGTDFIEGWHLKVIAEHLEALYYLDITDLLINQPFRTGKSMIGCVFFPAWVFLKDPSQSFLYTSYSQFFSARDSVKCRRLMQSEWYQKFWGKRVKLRRDVQNKLNFETTAGGYRLASSVDGGNTGGGANHICFPYETMVQTDLGELPIGKIVEENINCKILSYNHDLKSYEYKDILNNMKNIATELIEIQIGEKILRCTPEHPIYVENKGYIRADEIKEGDVVKILPEMFKGIQM